MWARAAVGDAETRRSVQLYTLMTLDVAIKNAGDGFLKEVANGGTAGGALPGVGARGLVEELGELARTVRAAIASISR